MISTHNSRFGKRGLAFSEVSHSKGIGSRERAAGMTTAGLLQRKVAAEPSPRRAVQYSVFRLFQKDPLARYSSPREEIR